VTIAIVNPLPAALAHYAIELDAVIDAAGEHALPIATPSIERIHGTSLVGRTARSLAWRRTFRAMPEDAVVVWPAYGYLDPLTLRRPRARTWLVVHDPVPLRRQWGLGRLASRLGRQAVRSPLTVLVHSAPAEAALADRGWPAHRIRHPIAPPGRISAQRGGTVRVLGQWKPARSLDALTQLADTQEWAGRLEISGRGWPTVPGWEVDSRFLDETELDDRIVNSLAVVLPYSRYFQSGIAIRCLERSIPIVGRSHPFLCELYGEDWPGVVTDGDWPGAVRRAAEVPAEVVRDRHERYWSACVEQWRQLFTRVSRGDPGERA
jgi:hypothetical protein